MKGGGGGGVQSKGINWIQICFGYGTVLLWLHIYENCTCLRDEIEILNIKRTYWDSAFFFESSNFEQPNGRLPIASLRR